MTVALGVPYVIVSGLAYGRCTRAPLWPGPLSPSTDTRVVSVVLRVKVLRSTHSSCSVSSDDTHVPSGSIESTSSLRRRRDETARRASSLHDAPRPRFRLCPSATVLRLGLGLLLVTSTRGERLGGQPTLLLVVRPRWLGASGPGPGRGCSKRSLAGNFKLTSLPVRSRTFRPRSRRRAGRHHHDDQRRYQSR